MLHRSSLRDGHGEQTSIEQAREATTRHHDHERRRTGSMRTTATPIADDAAPSAHITSVAASATRGDPRADRTSGSRSPSAADADDGEPTRDRRHELVGEHTEACAGGEQAVPARARGLRRRRRQEHADRVRSAVAQEHARRRAVPHQEPEQRTGQGERERGREARRREHAGQAERGDRAEPAASPSCPSTMFTALQQATVASTSPAPPSAPNGSSRSPPATSSPPAAAWTTRRTQRGAAGCRRSAPDQREHAGGRDPRVAVAGRRRWRRATATTTGTAGHRDRPVVDLQLARTIDQDRAGPRSLPRIGVRTTASAKAIRKGTSSPTRCSRRRRARRCDRPDGSRVARRSDSRPRCRRRRPP